MNIKGSWKTCPDPSTSQKRGDDDSTVAKVPVIQQSGDESFLAVYIGVLQMEKNT